MAKFELLYTSKFKKSVKKLNKEDIKAVIEILDKLCEDEPLGLKYCDHPLQGALKGFRDCHIRPDLVLIYEKRYDMLILKAIDIGSHAKVF
ncbi:type II toxin-antitoxin system YafQ family toxin [Campylobacter fetus]|uniref:type II toxin-antitoxin system RelE/ParE family toxin n=1 Tax=Campylobacter fetus TaxID=196 RepID=UPI00138E1D8F|nr:type II toxin-antitoxin system YafQ family toxin [Campylobacter fetus]